MYLPRFLVQDFINKEVKEHSDTFDSTDIRDIIDMYLTEAQRLEEEKAKEGGTKPYITKSEIWMCVFDLFLAGTETTSSSLLWFILLMACKPDVQEKVRNQLNCGAIILTLSYFWCSFYPISTPRSYREEIRLSADSRSS